MTRNPKSEPQLSWPNKDKYLIARGDGGYDWIDRTVALANQIYDLQEVGTFGEHPQDNLLIHGDARHALNALSAQPRFAWRYLKQAKLAYLDPPFNAGATYKHYRDRVPQSVWLTLIRDTLVGVKRILAEDGSVWVHLNDAEQHRARCVLDEVFGPEHFVATIIWDKTPGPLPNANPIAIRHDYIHVYRKSRSFTVRSTLDEPEGGPRRADTVWNFRDVGSGRAGSAESRRLFDEPFSTPKPERLLARVIAMATEPGDIVLDCFAGSGTAAAVAHKLGRRWAAVEAQDETLQNFVQPRMMGIVTGTDDVGISQKIGWTGGGGFTRLKVKALEPDVV